VITSRSFESICTFANICSRRIFHAETVSAAKCEIRAWKNRSVVFVAHWTTETGLALAVRFCTVVVFRNRSCGCICVAQPMPTPLSTRISNNRTSRSCESRMANACFSIHRWKIVRNKWGIFARAMGCASKETRFWKLQLRTILSLIACIAHTRDRVRTINSQLTDPVSGTCFWTFQFPRTIDSHVTDITLA